MNFKEVVENKEVIEYLRKRNLVKQYLKAKNFIINWNPELAELKLREPKEDKIYYFRINKQFRTFWISETKIIEETKEEIQEIKVLKVLKISNHQEK